MTVTTMRQQISKTIEEVTGAVEHLQTVLHDLPPEGDRTTTQDVVAHLAAVYATSIASVVASLAELRDAITLPQSME